MSIVSSAVESESAQADGRVWAVETHTDNIGLKHIIRYLANADVNTASVLAARAIQLANDILNAEVTTNIDVIKRFGALAVPTFNYSTKLQQAPALRQAYKTMTETEAVFTGEFLAGFTDNQLAAAFDITVQQVATLRTNKLTPAVNTAASIRATTGA